jgi:hypothetical protein
VTQKTTLPHAHDSLVDSKAQKEVVVNEDFRPFIDKSKSIVNLTDVWATKKKRHGEMHAESTRRVPDGWKEDETTTWELPDHMKCGQSEGACVPPSILTSEYGHL